MFRQKVAPLQGYDIDLSKYKNSDQQRKLIRPRFQPGTG